MQVSEKGLLKVLDKELSGKIASEIVNIPVTSARDYFHVMALHRAAVLESVVPGAMRKHYPELSNRYSMKLTGEIKSNGYAEFEDVIVQRKTVND
jgi:hypothetical protein